MLMEWFLYRSTCHEFLLLNTITDNNHVVQRSVIFYYGNPNVVFACYLHLLGGISKLIIS